MGKQHYKKNIERWVDTLISARFFIYEKLFLQNLSYLICRKNKAKGEKDMEKKNHAVAYVDGSYSNNTAGYGVDVYKRQYQMGAVF